MKINKNKAAEIKIKLTGKGRTGIKPAAVFFLGALALPELAPVLFLLSGSIMGSLEVRECLAPMLYGTEGFVHWRLIPLYPTLKNVVELLFDSPEYFVLLLNSLKMTGLILAGQLIVGTLAAWGLAQYQMRGGRGIRLLYVLLMLMPFQVMMLSEYLVLDKMNLLDKSAAVICPQIFSALPVFIMYRFFQGIPREVLEAARIAGADEWQIFWSIGLPMGRFGIMSAAVLSFLESYSMMEQPMTFLKNKALWPLSLYLPEIGEANGGFCLCSSLAIVLPAVIVLLCGQEYLESGIELMQ